MREYRIAPAPGYRAGRRLPAVAIATNIARQCGGALRPGWKEKKAMAKRMHSPRRRFLLHGLSPPQRFGRVALAVVRLLLCAVGAAIGLGLALWLVDPPSSPLFVASLGGSTVFLFGLTRAAAAQPRALFGGHLGGALIGILCFQALGDALWVYVLAVVLTLVYMLVTKTVHPPAGANPLIMLHIQAGPSALWQPVALSVLILALVAAAWSRVVPGLVRYPVNWLDRSPPTTFWGAWNE